METKQYFAVSIFLGTLGMILFLFLILLSVGTFLLESDSGRIKFISIGNIDEKKNTRSIVNDTTKETDTKPSQANLTFTGNTEWKKYDIEELGVSFHHPSYLPELKIQKRVYENEPILSQDGLRQIFNGKEFSLETINETTLIIKSKSDEIMRDGDGGCVAVYKCHFKTNEQLKEWCERDDADCEVINGRLVSMGIAGNSDIASYHAFADIENKKNGYGVVSVFYALIENINEPITNENKKLAEIRAQAQSEKTSGVKINYLIFRNIVEKIARGL